MRPLQDLIFETVKLLEQDGTFDQLKPVKSLLKRENVHLFSFDLSSATDRLPVLVQEILLQPILGVEGAKT